jgi:alcohol dehydrogenase (cytochrome c)
LQRAPAVHGRVRFAISAALAAALTGGISGATEPSSSSLPATFTADQARHGGRVYAASCARCHGTRLEGSAAPALAGPAFLRRWQTPTRSAADLYTLVRTSMPKLVMGSLASDDYTAVFAYLLQRNGWPAGSQAFDGSDTLLHAIRLDRLDPTSRPALEVPEFIVGEAKSTPPAGALGPTDAELANPDSGDWPYHNGGYLGTRYSRLTQLAKRNVDRLRVACVFQAGNGETFQTGPLVYQGVMYVTTVRETIAIDAAGCRPRWRHRWEPHDYELWPMNRGAALAHGYLVRGTADGYLVALDARDGALRWARHVARADSGETITMAPLITDDLVIVGPAGSENGIRGWVGAFRLNDGEPVWRFNTFPRSGESGAGTWQNPRGLAQGGGAVWTPLALDVPTGELYVAVTNPAPDLAPALRPGTNLYTNSVVALDVHSGALRWYDQLLPNDGHDWDVTQVSPLFRETVGGKERNMLATVGKAGVLTGLDRDTHERLYEVAVTTRLNADVPVGRERTHVCPGIHGGVAWNGPAYSPDTHLLYVPATDWCGTYYSAGTARHVPGVLYMGGSYVPDAESTAKGWLTALDARTGMVRWRYPSPKPLVAGVTATAGGLVFTGELTGDFIALDADTGRLLYRFYTGAGILGGVVTYAVGGRQYVAVASGGGSYNFGRDGSPTVLVFSLPASR